jgi:hypothetical protein
MEEEAGERSEEELIKNTDASSTIKSGHKI